MPEGSGCHCTHLSQLLHAQRQKSQFLNSSFSLTLTSPSASACLYLSPTPSLCHSIRKGFSLLMLQCQIQSGAWNSQRGCVFGRQRCWRSSLRAWDNAASDCWELDWFFSVTPTGTSPPLENNRGVSGMFEYICVHDCTLKTKHVWEFVSTSVYSRLT